MNASQNQGRMPSVSRARVAALALVLGLVGLVGLLQTQSEAVGAPPQGKVTICHATGSATNPFVAITVSTSAANGNDLSDHTSHEDDVIPAPAGGCDSIPTGPGPTPPGPGGTPNSAASVTVTAQQQQQQQAPAQGTAESNRAPARVCTSRRSFRIRIRSKRRDPVVSATVTVNGKRVKTLRGKRVTAPVVLRGLPKGRFLVKITATTRKGRKLSGTRRYLTCTPKSPRQTIPLL